MSGDRTATQTEKERAQTMTEVTSSRRADRVERTILRVLAELGGPVGAARLATVLADHGIELSPRAIRYHLERLDAAGLTRLVHRRRGRVLTERGAIEAERVAVPEKIGFISVKVDDLGYRMTYDVDQGTGTVVINVATLPERDLVRGVQVMEPVVRAHLGMGNRLILARAGERLGDYLVPPDHVAVGSICSVTVNGILSRRGIPVYSRYAGALELHNGRPVRFVDLIDYRGITCDPLELFVQAGRTTVSEAARTGCGVIGVSFREVPAAALDEVRRIARLLQARDMPAVLEIGRPGRPLLDVPVPEGRAGLIVLGGVNVFATLVEAGIPAEIHPLAGLADIRRFRPFREIALTARRQSPLID